MKRGLYTPRQSDPSPLWQLRVSKRRKDKGGPLILTYWFVTIFPFAFPHCSVAHPLSSPVAVSKTSALQP